MSHTGLHLRFEKSIVEPIRQALQYNTKTFQFFLTPSVKRATYITLDQRDRETFLILKKEFQSNLYIHTSYWINPATGSDINYFQSKKNLKKEIELANQLEIQHLILHPGAASYHKPTKSDPLCKHKGIETIVKMLTKVLKNNEHIEILLENTAHGNRSIGSNLDDFILLNKYFKDHKQVNFCFDIGHAFAFGYDVSNTQKLVDQLDETMGLDRIKLIHLNDTREKQGSKKDNHVIPGKGELGIETLLNFCAHPKIKNIPKIIELPLAEKDEIMELLSIFNK